jgi:hypothetical protein
MGAEGADQLRALARDIDRVALRGRKYLDARIADSIEHGRRGDVPVVPPEHYATVAAIRAEGDALATLLLETWDWLTDSGLITDDEITGDYARADSCVRDHAPLGLVPHRTTDQIVKVLELAAARIERHPPDAST